MTGDANTFTVIPRDWVYPADGLTDVDPSKLLNAFRSAMMRKGADRARGYLFAALHGEYDPTTGLFHLHIHGVASGGMLAVVDRLRQLPNYRFRRSMGDKRTRVKIGRKPLNNLPYPLTYIVQSSWPCRWRGEINDKEVRGTVRYRIPEPAHTQLLLWLDRWSLQDLTLMIGMSVGREGLIVSAGKRT